MLDYCRADKHTQDPVKELPIPLNGRYIGLYPLQLTKLLGYLAIRPDLPGILLEEVFATGDGLVDTDKGAIGHAKAQFRGEHDGKEGDKQSQTETLRDKDGGVRLSPLSLLSMALFVSAIVAVALGFGSIAGTEEWGIFVVDRIRDRFGRMHGSYRNVYRII